MLALPRELVVSILEYTCDDFDALNYYKQFTLTDIFNFWLTCKHFDYLKDKYYTIKLSGPMYTRILTCNLLNTHKLYGYDYEYNDNSNSPEYLTWCRYHDNGNELIIYGKCSQMKFNNNLVPIISTINGVGYNYDEKINTYVTTQIYDQLNNIDNIIKSWLLENNRSILIQDFVTTNKYVINIPNN